MNVGMSLDGFIAGANADRPPARRAGADHPLADELEIALAPVILGAGLRSFDRVDRDRVSPRIVAAIDSHDVTHLRYGLR